MKKFSLILIMFFLSIHLFANNDQWDNDFYLKNLTDSAKKTELFQQLMTEYGIATTIPFNEAADTLGRKGFETSFVYSFYSVGKTEIDGQNPWEGTFKGGSPGSLNLINIKVRKGLPGSFEVGSNFSYIFGSHLFTMGLTGKFAVLEGINILPDLAIRVTYNQLFGSRQVVMSNTSLDFIISYDFGINGMFSLAPYFAFSMSSVSAKSNLILKSDGPPYKCDNEFCDYGDDTNYQNNLESFGEFDKSVSRYVIGARIKNAVFIFIPEIVLTSEDVWGANVKIGIDF